MDVSLRSEDLPYLTCEDGTALRPYNVDSNRWSLKSTWDEHILKDQE
jgi:hypothetical protein